MSQTLHKSSGTLREAFYALSIAQDVPDATLLDDIVRRYSDFGAELTDFAMAIAVDALHGNQAIEVAEAAVDPGKISPAVSRAMSRFQNRLYATTANEGTARVEPLHSIEADAPNPFLSLSRHEFRALADGLNANTVFVNKLRDRQIVAATMTSGFQQRVAEGLKAPLDRVVAHFTATPNAPTGQFFKSDDKPSTGSQQTFEEAVRSSGLSEEQQRSLLEL